MSKEIITHKAADNQYFHKDFHIALNFAIDYLYENFGEKDVLEYLNQFSSAYFSPLKKSLLENGLNAIKEHYEKIYKIEKADYKMNFSEDEMTIHLLVSPAVIHIKGNGFPLSPVYHETVITVNKKICENTPFECEVIEYDHENGGYKLRFFKR